MEKRLYCIHVPQESVRTYFVTARSEDEAIELVNLGADEARARGCELEWCDQCRVPLDMDTWQVEADELSSSSQLERKQVAEGSPSDSTAPSAEGAAEGRTELPAGLTRGTARLLAEERTESWDLNDYAYFALNTLIDEYLADPRLFFEEWSERFEYPPTDPRVPLDRLVSWLELHQRGETEETEKRKERIVEIAHSIGDLLDSSAPEHAARANRAAELLTQALDRSEDEGRTITWTDLDHAYRQARAALGEAFSPDTRSEKRHETKNEPSL